MAGLDTICEKLLNRDRNVLTQRLILIVWRAKSADLCRLSHPAEPKFHPPTDRRVFRLPFLPSSQTFYSAVATKNTAPFLTVLSGRNFIGLFPFIQEETGIFSDSLILQAIELTVKLHIIPLIGGELVVLNGGEGIQKMGTQAWINVTGHINGWRRSVLCPVREVA